MAPIQNLMHAPARQKKDEKIHAETQSVFLVDYREWPHWEDFLSNHSIFKKSSRKLYLDDIWHMKNDDILNIVMQGRAMYDLILIDDRVLTLFSTRDIDVIIANSSKGKLFNKIPRNEITAYATRLPEISAHHNVYSQKLLEVRQRLENMGIPIDNAIWPPLTDTQINTLLNDELPLMVSSQDYWTWLNSVEYPSETSLHFP